MGLIRFYSGNGKHHKATLPYDVYALLLGMCTKSRPTMQRGSRPRDGEITRLHTTRDGSLDLDIPTCARC